MFTISSNPGTREGVSKVVAAAKAAGDKPTPEQVGQCEETKAYLLARIAAIPKGINGCRVSATGEVHSGGETLSVTIIPMNVHL